jgi:hypothetical protein
LEMDAAGIILMLIIILALAGVLAFIIRDYYKNKEDVENKFAETQKAINASVGSEKTDRLSNLKYVVDQVNNVNANIYDTLSSNVDKSNTLITGVRGTTDSIISGLDSVIKFTTNQTIAGAPSYVSLTNLPGVGNVDINLMKRVSMVSGMTAKSLEASNQATFCSKESPQKCLQFPNADGDTYFTSLKSGRNIVMDAPTVMTDSLNLKNTSTDASGGVNMTTASKKLKISADGVSVGSANVVPSAALHVEAAAGSTADLFKVKLGASDAILVDATGNVKVPAVNIVANNTVIGTITSDGVAASPGLKITSKKVTVDGDMYVNGSLSYKSGASNITLP